MRGRVLRLGAAGVRGDVRREFQVTSFREERGKSREGELRVSVKRTAKKTTDYTDFTDYGSKNGGPTGQSIRQVGGEIGCGAAGLFRADDGIHGALACDGQGSKRESGSDLRDRASATGAALWACGSGAGGDGFSAEGEGEVGGVGCGVGGDWCGDLLLGDAQGEGGAVEQERGRVVSGEEGQQEDNAIRRLVRRSLGEGGFRRLRR